VTNAGLIFEDALEWLRSDYDTYWCERDVVFTLQRHLFEVVPSGWQVFNDYPMIPGSRRALSADLVLRDPSGSVQLAAEFKYEPSAERADIQRHKLPVIGFADYCATSSGSSVSYERNALRVRVPC